MGVAGATPPWRPKGNRMGLEVQGNHDGAVSEQRAPRQGARLVLWQLTRGSWALWRTPGHRGKTAGYLQGPIQVTVSLTAAR